MADFVLKKGDTGISITGTLSDENGVVNLTGGSVAFAMRNAVTQTAKVDDAAATIVSGAAGTVRYDWGAGDVDTAGEFEAEWVYTDSGGEITRFPRNINSTPRTAADDRYISIEIIESVT